MSLLNWAKNQFIEIIEWQDDSRDTLSWKFPVAKNEIKQGAQLTVREGQQAVFLNEGTIADVFGPGRHVLTTKNLPVLATLKGWKYGFESPFKADVVFIATRRFADLKWGTQNPVMLRDADFGVLRLRGFGTYALRVVDPKVFVAQLGNTTGQVLVGDVQDHLRNKLVARFTDTLGESKVAALDLAARYDELSTDLEARLNIELSAQGMGITDLHIENISLPPEVEKALDARSKMNVLGDLNKYTQLQVAESMPTAAANTGLGGAGVGMGFGAGVGAVMGQQIAQAVQPGAAAPRDAFAAPPAGSAASTSPVSTPPTGMPGVRPKFCSDCGVALAPTGKFCASCGHPVG